jgi:hypothetical protein
MYRCLIIGALFLSIHDWAEADEFDLAKIDRTIGKEPDYQTAFPQYCLLVFGRQAKTHIWLVVDGKNAYIDRNSNGDLSDEGERVTSDSTSFDLGDIKERATQLVHHTLRLTVYKNAENVFSFRMSLSRRQKVGYGAYAKPKFGDSPESAPILHFNGPPTFARYGPISFLTRNVDGHSYRKTYLRLYAGSPGIGENTFVSYDFRAIRYICGEYPAISADILFPNSDPDKGTIRSTQALKVKG